MSKGWSVRVVSKRLVAGTPTVEWYYVAEPESEKAVQAVRAVLEGAEAEIEAVKQLPVLLLNGRELKPGQVQHVYRRGMPPGRAPHP